MQDRIKQRQGEGRKVSSIERNLGRLSQVLHGARDMRNIDIDPGLVLEARRKLLRHHPVNTRLRDRIPTADELHRLSAYFREDFFFSSPLSPFILQS